MTSHIVFEQHHCACYGTLLDIAMWARAREQDENDLPVLIFEMDTGRQIDIDTRGTETEIQTRFALPDTEENSPQQPGKGKRGRPKLGVVGREVTLLPRHWEWLDRQRGGASGTIRRLVDEARKQSAHSDGIRMAQDRTNRFISAIAGDLPGFEEATRALYSGNEAAFVEHVNFWPKDVRTYTLKFSDGAF
ncbi:MAG: DUF2239 family protein [Agarilytica sp.]